MEAKEGLPLTAEMRVSATISYQALFGYYAKLAGMTVCVCARGMHAELAALSWQRHPAIHHAGSPPLPSSLMLRTCAAPCHNTASGTSMELQGTAATQAEELSEAYRLDVVRVPPHRRSARTDLPLQGFYFQEVSEGVPAGWAGAS